MQRIFINQVDKTEYLEQESIILVEMLNNRPNSLKCKFLNYDPSYGQSIDYYIGGGLSTSYSSGVDTIVVDDDLSAYGFYRTGDVIVLSPHEAEEEILKIDSVSGTTLVFARVLRNSHSKGAIVGKKKFGGILTKPNNTDLGYAGDTTGNILAIDYTSLFNRKHVVESFEDMYALEIISRVNSFFVADDEDPITLDDCETADWTESGVAKAELISTDSVYGSSSLRLGATGAGVATYEQTFTAVDLTSYDSMRNWLKFASGALDKMTSFKVRMGTDSSNYYEWSISINDLKEECWFNWTSKINNYTTKTGTVNMASIGYIAVVFTATELISIGDVLIDNITGNAGGFSMNNVSRGAGEFSDVRIQYKKCSVAIEKIAKLLNYFWYIDEFKDLYFFSQNEIQSPFDIEAGVSTNYSNISISPDMTQLKNRQTVKGGEAPTTALYTQEQETDGLQDSWTLDYKPKDLEVWIDSGSGYVQKTVGVENLNDETLFDYVFNFAEKVVRITTAGTKPSAGDSIKLIYYPYKSIRIRAQDPTSISAMKALTGGDGVYDGALITDFGIKTYEEARTRANAELKAYANPIINITFDTEIEGLHAGQVIHITDSTRGIDDDFLIQKVNAKQTYNHIYNYKVICASTLFGIIEFFQLLLKKTDDLIIDASELVDVVINDDEILDFDETWTLTTGGAPWYAMDDPPSPTTSNDAYCGFCEVN